MFKPPLDFSSGKRISHEALLQLLDGENGEIIHTPDLFSVPLGWSGQAREGKKERREFLTRCFLWQRKNL